MSQAKVSGPLERYLKIIEVVAGSPEGLNLTDIAGMTGLPMATVHRLTRALLETGVLRADRYPGKTLLPGGRLWRILYLGLSRDTVSNYAQLVCDELASRLEETSYVAALMNREVCTLARCVPEEGYRLHVIPGRDLPLHAASAAKAILAYQTAELLETIYPEPLPRLTARTKTSPAACLAELEGVKRLGFAQCDREIEDNVIAYACPVQLPQAGVLYSVGVTGPYSRLKKRQPEVYRQALIQASKRFAGLLQSVAS